MTRNPKRPVIVLYPLLVVLTAAVLYLSAGNVALLRNKDEDYRKVDLFTHVQTLIEQNYLEQVDGWEVLFSGLKKMAELDRYSTFLTPEEGARFNEDTHRQYHGIGFVVRPKAPPLTVDYLFEGSPAEKSGIHPGDRVVAIDGVPIEQFDEVQATAAIKGEEGTLVKLKILCADDGSLRELSVARARIARPTVFTDYYVDPEGKVGYARLDSFGQNTLSQLDRALKDMADKGVSRLVLDLRFNEGGVVDVCKEVANRFLKSGDIVGIRYRDPDKNMTHKADPDHCSVPDWPVVVLVNRYTASASEIVAGALQDHKRAMLVGERTYGKGVVQSIYPLTLEHDHDRKAMLKITTGEYLTPAGRAIDSSIKRSPDQTLQGGLSPDIHLKLDPKQEIAVARRLRLLEVPSRYRATYLESHQIELPDREDRQLDAALRILRGETVLQDL